MTWHHWASCADSDLEPAAWTDRADDMQWGRSDANRAALDTCSACPVRTDCLAANDWMLLLSGDEVLPTDAPWPLRASLADWSRMALAWVEGL